MSKKLFLLSVLLGFCVGANAQKDADEYTTDQPSVTITTTNLKKQWQLTALFNGKSKTKPWIDRNNNGKYDAGEESIKKYGITRFKRTQPTITIYGDMTFFSCNLNELVSIDVSKCPDLGSLYCEENQIEKLDVSKNTNLQKLYCHTNKLSELKLPATSEVIEFYCFRNRLNELDPSVMPKLQEFYCGENNLTQLDITKNTQLTLLACNNNKIKKIDISKSPLLQKVYLFDNEIETVDISKNSALAEFHCYNNKLTNITIGDNIELTALTVSGNKLKALDIRKLVNLTDLQCDNNQLAELNIAANQKLGFISCYSNQIANPAMKRMLADLPDMANADNKGELVVVDTKDEDEKNVCYEVDVTELINAKNWTAYDYQQGLNDGRNLYEGEKMPNGIERVAAAKIKVSTVPKNNVLAVQLPLGMVIATARIFGANGALLRTVVLHTAENQVDVANFTAGVYFLNVNGETQRFVVER